MAIFALYRQPDDTKGNHRSTHVEFKQALSQIEVALGSLYDPIPDSILCGDFNLPHTNWPGGTEQFGAPSSEKAMLCNLQSLTEEHFLRQNISKPTHRGGNILDLLAIYEQC